MNWGFNHSGTSEKEAQTFLEQGFGPFGYRGKLSPDDEKQTGQRRILPDINDCNVTI